MYPYQVLIAKEEKKLETINKQPRLLIFVLFDSCLLSTPLFQCKAKNHTRTRFLKRAVFWTSHKANCQIMAYANLLLFK